MKGFLMFVTLLNKIRERADLCGLALGILLYFSGLFGFSFWGASSPDALEIWGLGIAIGWLICWLPFRFSILKPLDRLTGVCESLASRDVPGIARSLAALAQGNLTTRLSTSTGKFSSSTLSRITKAEGTVNIIIDQLNESCKEYNSLTSEPCDRLFFLGTDTYEGGRTAGEAMGQAIGGHGDVLIVTGSLNSVAQNLRCKGFQSVLHENHPSVHVLATVESLYDADKSYELTKEHLRRNPDIAGVYATDGTSGPGAARAAAELGLGGKLKIVCFDLVDESVDAIMRGNITAAVVDDLFAQGYDPVVHMFNHLADGWMPESARLRTHMDLVTRENINLFWSSGAGLIQSDEMKERRARPVKRSSRAFKIAVLCVESSAYYLPMRNGVLAAADMLREYGCKAEWIVPELSRGSGFVDSSARAFGPSIEELVSKGYNGIITLAEDYNLVPIINRAVRHGVTVATFMVEPTSLRGSMDSMVKRAHALLGVAQELALSAKNTGEATRQTADTIQQMADAVHNEAGSVSKVERGVKSISESMNYIAQSL